MPLLALGINHKTAPVEIRERVTFAPEAMHRALDEIGQLPQVLEAAILSTCNRTELYCVVDADEAVSDVIDWLSRFHRLSVEDLNAYMYTHSDEDAVRHMLRVASGLDSMILGEPQILGQMKAAFQSATQSGSLGTLLGRLFQHSFLVAKRVRTDTAIGASPVSVAFAAVSLAKQIFGDLPKQTALLIGAGETVELAARHLHDNQIGRIIVANRTVERAHDLAAQFDGYAIALSEIPAHLEEVDIIVSSTASREPILEYGEIKRVLKKRKHQPIFMVDIAVPRDIDPKAGELDDVYLYTVDDLHDVIQENLSSRHEAAKQAEEIIDVQVSHFLGWLKSLDAVDTIRACRDQAEAHQREVLEKAKRMVEHGKPPEEALQYLAHTLTNKLLHNPSVHLKEAGAQGRGELIRAARELFELDRSSKKS